MEIPTIAAQANRTHLCPAAGFGSTRLHRTERLIHTGQAWTRHSDLNGRLAGHPCVLALEILDRETILRRPPTSTTQRLPLTSAFFPKAHG